MKRLIEAYRIKQLTDRNFYAIIIAAKVVIAAIVLIGLLFFAFQSRNPASGQGPFDLIGL